MSNGDFWGLVFLIALFFICTTFMLGSLHRDVQHLRDAITTTTTVAR